MGAGTGLVLSLLMTAAFLYVLYFVIRAAVESGIRRALTQSLLRPTVQELIDESALPGVGEHP